MKAFLLTLVLSLSAYAEVAEESEALRALRLSCEKQRVGLGCFNYANMLIRSNKSDDSEKYYEKGCKLGHTPSCEKEKWDLPERQEASNEIIPVSREMVEPTETVVGDSLEYKPLTPTILPNRISLSGTPPAEEKKELDPKSGSPDTKASKLLKDATAINNVAKETATAIAAAAANSAGEKPASTDPATKDVTATEPSAKPPVENTSIGAETKIEPQPSPGTAPASVDDKIAPEDIPSPESLDFSM